MTPEAFLQRLRELAATRDWQGVADWVEAHYEVLKPHLDEAGRDKVECGFMPTAHRVLAGRRWQAEEEAAERELAHVA